VTKRKLFILPAGWEELGLCHSSRKNNDLAVFGRHAEYFAKTNQHIIIFYFSGKNPFCLFQGLCKLITHYFACTWKLSPSSHRNKHSYERRPELWNEILC